jgi:putative membrane protein
LPKELEGLRMWGFGPFGGFFHAWWALANSVFWIAVVVFLVAAFSRAGRHPAGPFWRSTQALDILEQRYARGEIGRDEYLQKKNDLMSRGPGA